MNADELRLLYFKEHDKADRKLTFEQWLRHKELQKGEDWWKDRKPIKSELSPRNPRPPIPAKRAVGRCKPGEEAILVTEVRNVDGKEQIYKTIKLQKEIDRENELAEIKKTLKEEVAREVLGSITHEKGALTSSDGAFVIHYETPVFPDNPQLPATPNNEKVNIQTEDPVEPTTRKKLRPVAQDSPNDRVALIYAISEEIGVEDLEGKKAPEVWGMIVNEELECVRRFVKKISPNKTIITFNSEMKSNRKNFNRCFNNLFKKSVQK